MKKIALLATLFNRKESARKAIASIVNQVDEVWVTLNIQSDDVDCVKWSEHLTPDGMSHKVLFSLRNNELGDVERYFQVNPDNDPCYFFAIDDDLVFPETYTETLIRGIEKYGCPCSFHGRKILAPLTSYHHDFKNQLYYSCRGTVDEDVEVNVVGTGVMGWRSDMLDLSYSQFCRKNMADIEVARLVHAQKTKLMVLAHEEGWILYTPQREGETIWEQRQDDGKEELELINNLFFSLPQHERQTISVSMIARNEANHIERALKSVKDFDEVVVVDTGSEDNTVEIARKYTDKVFTDYKWNDNFAEARNISLGHCTGDWIFVIDGDEMLGINGVQKIRTLLSKLPPYIDAVYINCVAESDKSTHSSIRLFKNNKVIRWEGWIHNYIVGTKGTWTDLSITHYHGYSTAHNLDPHRTKRICKKYLDRYPDAARERYYYAREFWYEGDFPECIRQLSIYLKLPNRNPAEKADGWLMKARCHQALGQLYEAQLACFEAVLMNPEFAEAFWVIAETTTNGIHSQRWRQIAKSASNSDVLFLRNLIEEDATFNYNGFDHTFRTDYPSDHIFNIIRHTKGFYEQVLLEKLRSIAREGVYVDVGANIGNHTVYFAIHCPATKVIAFEICPAIFSILKDNIEGCPNTKAYNVGIGEKKKTVSIGEINPMNVGMTRITEEGGEYKIDTLDNRLKSIKDIAVIKIDAEGYELNVIKGAKEILSKWHPVVVAELKNQEEYDAFKAEIEPLGYATDNVNYAITPTYIWLCGQN